jgi:Ion channel
MGSEDRDGPGGGSAAGGPKTPCVLSALLMFERFARALKIAVRDEGFAQILGTGLLLVIVGTLTYTTSQDWSLVDGFYFAVATLTTSSIADPDLMITGAPIKIFTVFYVLVGIGILVEIARQLGFAYIEVRRVERAAKAAKADQPADT